MMEKRRTGRPSGRPSSQDAISVVRAAETDMWMYSAAGPRLFKLGEEIPAEYEDSPAKLRQ
jgi:hypothetical protein